MTHKFTTGVRFNHHLGTLETLSFLGEGVGAALYITAIVLGLPSLAMLGIAFVVVAVVALRQHLGQPTRGWRAVTRFAFAWVSRGTLAISGFVGLSVLAVAAGHVDPLAPYRPALTWAAQAFAVPVIVYAGMLLRSMKAIRLWRGVFVPLAFTAHSLATAFTIGAATAAWLALDANAAGWLAPFALACLLLGVAASVLHMLRVERSPGTRASLQRLLAGDLRGKLLFGAGIVGVVVPAVILVAAPSGAPAVALLTVAAMCRLYGDFAYRNAIVLAGAYEPIAPPGSFRRSST